MAIVPRALSDVEAAQLAVTVERIGAAFYQEAARLTDTAQVFTAVAEEEKKHVVLVQSYLAKSGVNQPV